VDQTLGAALHLVDAADHHPGGLGSSVAAAKADYDNWPSYDARMKDGPHYFAVLDAFPMEGYVTVMLAAGVIGAIAMAGEYSSGLIRTTTVAVPAREAVVLAKAVVQVVVWTVWGWIAAIGSFVIAQSILSGRHTSIAFGTSGVLRAMAAAALLAPVCALVGLGIGTLVRHSAATIGITAFTLLMLPAFFAQSKHWSADVNHGFIRPAFERLLQLWTLPKGMPGFYQGTITGSWIVYLLWPLAAVALALLVVRRRNV
jgi:hypothetical protein